MRLRRILATAVVAAAVLGALGAQPASAAVVYDASASPLAIDGTDYSQPFAGASEPGAWWLAGGAGDPPFVTADDTEIPGIDGTQNVDVVLATLQGGGGPAQLVTTYITPAVFTQLGQPRTCAGFVAGMSSIGITATCAAIKTDFLVSGGSGNDYTFSGYTGFLDDNGDPLVGTVALASSFSTEPSLTARVVPDPPTDATFAASAVGFSIDATTYTDPFGGCSAGVLFVYGDENVCVTDGTPLPDYPGGAGVRAWHAVLLSYTGGRSTVILDAMMLVDPTCDGFMSEIGPEVPVPGLACDAFKVAVLTPNGATSDYTFTGYDGFTTGDGTTPLAGTVSAASDPAITYVGDGPTPTPTPDTTPTEPENANEATGATGGTGSTLPRTGIAVVLAPLGAGMALTGLGLARLARRMG